MSVPKDLKNEDETVDKIVEGLSEDVPEWAIADIVHNKIINSGYNSTSRRIYLQKFTDKLNVEGIEENDSQSNLLKYTMKLRKEGYPYWAISDMLATPLHKIIYVSRIWNSKEAGKPWKEIHTLQKLFLEKKSSFFVQKRYFTEISDICGCHQETVRTAVDKMGISQSSGNSNRPSSRNVWYFKSMEIPDSDDLVDGSLSFGDIIDQKKPYS